MEDGEKIKKQYEIGILVRKEDDISEVRRLVAAHEGEFVGDFQAKKIALSYPIKKEKEAVFAWCGFRASGEEVKRLEKDLRTAAAVLRSLIIISLPLSERSPDMAAVEKKWVRAKREPVATEPKTAPHSLSNEALTKKIEEMLK
jgi:ribosomal protein S6